MQTDLSWVEELHARLAVRYGDKWSKMWEGFSLDDMAVVRQDWANVLHNCTTGGLLFALDNLPVSWPPTAGEFLEIVRRKPVANEAQQAIAGPRLTPAEQQAELERLNTTREAFEQRDPSSSWIADLQARQARGERLTITQRDMLRAALPRYRAATAPPMPNDFKGVAAANMPAAMRPDANEPPPTPYEGERL
jgi:hypothetical protein